MFDFLLTKSPIEPPRSNGAGSFLAAIHQIYNFNELVPRGFPTFTSYLCAVRFASYVLFIHRLMTLINDTRTMFRKVHLTQRTISYAEIMLTSVMLKVRIDCVRTRVRSGPQRSRSDVFDWTLQTELKFVPDLTCLLQLTQFRDFCVECIVAEHKEPWTAASHIKLQYLEVIFQSLECMIPEKWTIPSRKNRRLRNRKCCNRTSPNCILRTGHTANVYQRPHIINLIQDAYFRFNSRTQEHSSQLKLDVFLFNPFCLWGPSYGCNLTVWRKNTSGFSH